jgi:hypothetical protein
MLLSIGDQVRPGTYRFHSRFNRAVNFEHEGRLIAVVDEAIGPGPLNIVLRDLPAAAPALPALKEIPPLQVGPKTVLFAGHRYRFTATIPRSIARSKTSTASSTTSQPSAIR